MEILTVGQIRANLEGQFFECNSEGSDINQVTVSRIVYKISRIVQNSVYILPVEYENDSEFIDRNIDIIRRKGAVLIISSTRINSSKISNFVVKDRREVIRKLGHIWRRCFDIPVITVTGSNGKSTISDMIHYIFSHRFKTLRTTTWPNQKVLDLFRLEKEHQVAVVESSNGHPGGNKFNGYIVQPDVVVFTNLDYVHIKNFGENATLDDVYNSKIEIVEFLSPTGLVYINGSHEYYKNISLRKSQRLRTYGFSPDMDFYADEIKFNDDYTTSCSLHTENESVDVVIPSPGIHLVLAALASFAVSYDFGFDLETIRCAIESFPPRDGRNNIIQDGLSVTLIDDSYNASPESTKAAIDVLMNYRKKSRKVFVFGGMAELGTHSLHLHESIGKYINQRAGIDAIACSGPYAKEVADQLSDDIKRRSTVFLSRGAEDIEEVIEDFVHKDDVVLVKASRRYHFEIIADGIKRKFLQTKLLNVRADCCAIYDIENEEYLCRKEILRQYVPASNVKILTALIVLEKSDLEAEVEISEFFAQKYNFIPHEKFKVKDCLCALLISSVNSMGDILATFISGSIKAFVKYMNDYARKIGMKYSKFVDPHGKSRNNRTCVLDMVQLCKYASKNEIFMDVIQKEKYICSSTEREYVFVTTNKTIIKNNILYHDSSLGGKTGGLSWSDGIKKKYLYTFVNYFGYNNHIYLTIQGGINWENPLYDDELENGSDIRFIDSVRMYEHMILLLSGET